MQPARGAVWIREVSAVDVRIDSEENPAQEEQRGGNTTAFSVDFE